MKTTKPRKIFLLVIALSLIIPLALALQSGFLEVKTLCLNGDCRIVWPANGANLLRTYSGLAPITVNNDSNEVGLNVGATDDWNGTFDGLNASDFTLDRAYDNGSIIQIDNTDLDFNIHDGTGMVIRYTNPSQDSYWESFRFGDQLSGSLRVPFLDVNVETNFLNGINLGFFDPSGSTFGQLFFDDNFFTWRTTGAGDDILILANNPDSNIHIASGDQPGNYATTFIYGELILTNDPIGGAKKTTSTTMSAGSRSLIIDGNVIMLDGNLDVLQGSMNLSFDLNNNNSGSDANFNNLEADFIFGDGQGITNLPSAPISGIFAGGNIDINANFGDVLVSFDDGNFLDTNHTINSSWLFSDENKLLFDNVSQGIYGSSSSVMNIFAPTRVQFLIDGTIAAHYTANQLTFTNDLKALFRDSENFIQSPKSNVLAIVSENQIDVNAKRVFIDANILSKGDLNNFDGKVNVNDLNVGNGFIETNGTEYAIDADLNLNAFTAGCASGQFFDGNGVCTTPSADINGTDVQPNFVRADSNVSVDTNNAFCLNGITCSVYIIFDGNNLIIQNG